MRATSIAQAWSTGYATNEVGIFVGKELDRLLGSEIDASTLGGAFAAMQSSSGRLRLISDRHGAVPLYYAHDSAGWVASAF